MKRFQKFTKASMLSLALSTFVLSGCAHNDRYTQNGDDKAITESINTALHHSRGYTYPDVKVSSQRGVVYLDGAVDYQEQKTRAEKVARSVDGVHDVVSNVAVRQYPTGRMPETPVMPDTPEEVP